MRPPGRGCRPRGITPRPSPLVERDSLFRTPRTLNEPVRWNSSALKRARAPSVSDSVPERSSGVRCTRPSIALRAPDVVAVSHGRSHVAAAGRAPARRDAREGRQAAGDAVDLDGPAHRLRQLLHDREPEARADRPLAAVALVEVEALERVLVLLRLQPGPGVLDPQCPRPAPGGSRRPAARGGARSRRGSRRPGGPGRRRRARVRGRPDDGERDPEGAACGW